MTKKIYSVLMLIILTTVMVLVGYHGQNTKVEVAESVSLFQKNKNIEIWYTDEALSDYLSRAALQYYEETDIRVIPTYVSGLLYLEQINRAEIDGTNVPDLYIVSNDMLQKAYLSGLAAPIIDIQGIVNSQYFPKSALSAVTYDNKLLGYPLYFETSVFLYNDTYMYDMAVSSIETEQNAAEGEEAQQMADAAQTDEEIEALIAADAAAGAKEIKATEEEIQNKKEQLIPVSIERILTFAESYEAPENVEAVFKWDVSDIFYNYFIVGDSICIGGENGDNINQIDIYNQSAIDCMTVYQNLNQFFSIDSASVTYDEVLQDFIEGKIVFTVATTDAISRLQKAKESGEFKYEYAITSIPQVSEALTSRSLSVTDAIVINGYSEEEMAANDFAAYLIKNQGEDFYTLTNKIPAKTDIIYENAAIYPALEEYAVSIPIPKMMYTSNFWAQLEIAFTKIWDGEDVSATLQELDQTVKNQISETE